MTFPGCETSTLELSYGSIVLGVFSHTYVIGLVLALQRLRYRQTQTYSVHFLGLLSLSRSLSILERLEGAARPSLGGPLHAGGPRRDAEHSGLDLRPHRTRRRHGGGRDVRGPRGGPERHGKGGPLPPLLVCGTHWTCCAGDVPHGLPLPFFLSGPSCATALQLCGSCWRTPRTRMNRGVNVPNGMLEAVEIPQWGDRIVQPNVPERPHIFFACG